jgi:hypothetical protein
MEKIANFFREKSKNMDALPNMITKSFVYAIPKQYRFLETLNREQLFKGIRADDSEIKPDYTPRTIQIKKAKSQPVDRVTLKDKGNFYSSIRANLQADSVKINASDSKTPKLEAKYKPEIIGVTFDNRQIVARKLAPDMLRYIIEKIFRK